MRHNGWRRPKFTPRTECEFEKVAAFRRSTLEESLQAGHKRIACDFSYGGASCDLRTLNHSTFIHEEVLETVEKLMEIANEFLPIEGAHLVGMAPPNALDSSRLSHTA
jgi:hypothetical protein